MTHGTRRLELERHSRRERIGDGIVRQMIHGERLMICRLTIRARHVTTAAHRHDARADHDRREADGCGSSSDPRNGSSAPAT